MIVKMHMKFVALILTVVWQLHLSVSAQYATMQNSIRMLGRPCSNTAECASVQFSHCHEGICECEVGYITQDSRCLIHTNEECPGTTPVSELCADPHASCRSEPFQYPSGWWGTVSYCRCDEGFLHHQASDQCRRAIGEVCMVNVSCVAGECNGATGLCACPGFLVPSSDGLTCLAGLGALCSTVACADENAECVDNVCACSDDFQTSSRPGDDRPKCRKRLGASCEAAGDCAAEQAGCEDVTLRAPGARACLCSEGHVPGIALDTCLPVRGVLGEACSVAAQCTAWLGRHSACIDSGCACADSYTYDRRASSCVRQ